MAALAFLTGCGTTTPTGSTYTFRDATAGPDMDVTLDNLLESSEDRSYLVWLNAVRVRDGEWEARYYLEVRYQAASDAGFLEILPGDSLVLTVDGQTMRFRGPGSGDNRKKLGNGQFVENAVFETKADDLRKIAKAKDIKVQVNGKKRKMYREFSEENRQKFRSFVLMHMGF